MARGNRRADIVLDDGDRRRFVETMEEVVESSGWVLCAYNGEQTRDHGVAEAQRIMNLAQEEMGITDGSKLKKGDWRKGPVATLIRKPSIVDNGWLAQHLAMGARTAVSRIMGQSREGLKTDRKVKTIARKLEKKISQT